MNLKIVYASSNSPDKPNYMLDAFLSIKDINIVSVFNNSEYKSYHNRRKNIPLMVSYKIGLPLDITKFNDRIIEACNNHKPDYLFISKGNEVRPTTLNTIRNNNNSIKIVNWSLDDMYSKHNRSVYYKLCIKYFDLIVTTKSYNCNQDELPSLGAKKILFQNNAYSTRFHKKCNNCNPVKEKHDVIFVGSFEECRAKSIYYLAKNGICVNVYGSGWSKRKYEKFKHNNIKHHEELRHNEYNNAISCSKISLSFLRKANRDLQTLRTVEIPAAGGFMLAEESDEQKVLFRDGIEAVYFSDNQDLLNKVTYYLSNKKERVAISDRAIKRCIEKKMSFKYRALEVLRVLNNI